MKASTKRTLLAVFALTVTTPAISEQAKHVDHQSAGAIKDITPPNADRAAALALNDIPDGDDARASEVPVSLASIEQTEHQETEQSDLEKIAAKSAALTVSDDGDAMFVASDVWFEFGQAELRPDAVETLEVIAKELQSVKGLRVIGHTDSIGGAQANDVLGQLRAETVREWLVSIGTLAQDAVIADSDGENSPIASNLLDNGGDNPAGRAQNRRVEFQIIEETS
ncbi:MAG: OmpA family protein [Litoreibacter sp.]